MEVMQKLMDGIVQFRKEDFEEHRELFKNLGTEQKPHTLFITCSDSRLDPNMITNTLPGELFTIRNIANLVPPYRETSEFVATTAAIEYAVVFLEVENIIVCGHSNCGGCNACLKPPEYLETVPHTKKWLELAHPVRDHVLRNMGENDPEAMEWMMEQENIVEQLKHLLTYPYIKERVEAGQLTLSGWYYIIETGEIFMYESREAGFILANG